MSESTPHAKGIDYSATLPEGIQAYGNPTEGFEITSFENKGDYRKYVLEDEKDPQNTYELFASNKVVIGKVDGIKRHLNRFFRSVHRHGDDPLSNLGCIGHQSKLSLFKPEFGRGARIEEEEGDLS